MNLAVAERLCGAALDAATALGFDAAVAVVDGGGHLVAFRRSDGASFVTAVVAPRKAWTAAASGLSSERWNGIASDPEVAPILHGTGLLAVAGGVPILTEGGIAGGVGVSGGTAAQDHEVALRALAAVRC